MIKVPLLKRLTLYLSDKKEIISSGTIKTFEDNYKKLLYNYTKLSKGILKKIITISMIPFFFLCNVGSAFSVNPTNNQGARPKEPRSSTVGPPATTSGASSSSTVGVTSSRMSSGIVSGAMGSHHPRMSTSSNSEYWMGRQPQPSTFNLSSWGSDESLDLYQDPKDIIGGVRGSSQKVSRTGRGSQGIYGQSMVPLSPGTQRKEQVKLWVKEESDKMKPLPLNKQVELWGQLKDGCVEQSNYWLKEVEKNKKYAEQCEKRVEEAINRSVNGSLQDLIEERLRKAEEYREEAAKALEKSKLHLEESRMAETRLHRLTRSGRSDSSPSMSVAAGVSGQQQQHYPSNTSRQQDLVVLVDWVKQACLEIVGVEHFKGL